MVFGSNRRIVQRESGPQTITGAGDTLIDNYGNHYREVDAYEAASIRSGTGGHVYTIDRDGYLR